MIYTASGRSVNPFDLRPEDVRVEDVAHHLALLNRFTGATRRPVNVAQHSVYVARLVRGRLMKEESPFGDVEWDRAFGIIRQSLVHDAVEAFFNDVSKWVKGTAEMAPYRRAEKEAQRKVYRYLGLPEEEHPLIEWADRVMVRYEMHRALPPGCTVGHNCPERESDYPPLTVEEVALVGKWKFWGWKKARRKFLKMYRDLTEGA